MREASENFVATGNLGRSGLQVWTKAGKLKFHPVTMFLLLYQRQFYNTFVRIKFFEQNACNGMESKESEFSSFVIFGVIISIEVEYPSSEVSPPIRSA